MQQQKYFSPSSSSHASRKENWLFQQHPTDYAENSCYFSLSPTAAHNNNSSARQQQMEQEDLVNYCYGVFGDSDSQ